MKTKMTVESLESLVSNLEKMRRYRPFAYSGKWFVVQTKDGFSNYRTKRAAANNSTTNQLWEVTL